MTHKATLYHNPSCSKCRTAYSLLEEYNASHPPSEKIDVHFVEYLETPLDAPKIEEILSMLFPNEDKPNPVLMMRTSNKEFGEMQLDKLDPLDASQRQVLIEAMVKMPSLIERPIFVKDGRAVIARPPDRLFELLEKEA
ncbi:unnamed protein product [Aphanomyces euteiches]|uniref:Arsenate reductase n=1 Tax=Aphanomyces euteiches TaxID=100861 RepID=A0A6G0WVV9_9STRA|nr:hypothetical protein Ae201684_011229 [Aphanomyces euteiches]KAH9058714.1 hypothetical protein Ae201684P_006055 [Aphanomyces euteiches]KAH9121937.1 hypothetical protein LEN26_010451 [Aphanomyces euteiches]KAH9145644.1 hypothetical protein AeRB84_010455 [Aphanomyces euteiches]